MSSFVLDSTHGNPRIISEGIQVFDVPVDWIPAELADLEYGWDQVRGSSNLIPWDRIPRLAMYLSQIYPEIYPSPAMVRSKLIQYLQSLDPTISWYDFQGRIVHGYCTSDPQKRHQHHQQLTQIGDFIITEIHYNGNEIRTYYVVKVDEYQKLYDQHHAS